MHIELDPNIKDEKAHEWVKQVNKIFQESTSHIDWDVIYEMAAEKLLTYGQVVIQTNVRDNKIEITVDK